MLKKFNLDKKFALITGAGGLLGYEHAYALLEAGSNVVITDINLNKLDKAYKKLNNIFKDKIIIKKVMNITKEKSINACKNFLLKKKIQVSILINNASFNPQPNDLSKSLFEKYSLKKWNSEINVGLTGAFLCSKIFGSQMVRAKLPGVIINISSDLSIISPDNRLYNSGKKIKKAKPVSYSVVKTGINGLTRYLSTYWASKNIRCNSLSPGGVENNQDIKFLKKLSKNIPLGRMAKKHEYHSAIQFLCSDASSYMTGQNLIIDGGRSIW
jgi:NAD(P)-dependent dehydrogenase (short-subunit alcohol dehydrogenase family)